jgi:ATP-dependent DNA helicase DinG
MDKAEKKSESKRLPVVAGNHNFDPEYVLGADGPIAKDLDGFQVRKPQIILAQQIQKAFADKRNLIAEAATGTGKSFANLLAAFDTAINTNTPVVISTHTISLQEQLLDKDVPFLLRHMGLLGKVKVSLSKGRGNYVSIRRAKIAIKEKQAGHTKLAEWLKDTKDGTLSSLPFKPAPGLWGRARSDSDQCLGDRCPTFSQCFYQKSRTRMGESHVIITNHNLVLLDRKIKSQGMKGVLPDYNFLILDEAHEIESVARQVFTFELRQKDLAGVLFELWNEKGSGFLNDMWTDSVQGTLGETQPSDTPTNRAIQSSVKAIKECLDENDKFFRSVAKYVGNLNLRRIKERQVIKTDLYAHLSAVLGAFKSVAGIVHSKDHKLAVDFAAKRCTEIALGIDGIQTLPNVPNQDYSDTVAWASARTMPNKSRVYSVTSAPVFLKGILRKMLFSPVDSVILTSATLASGGNDPFRMLRSTLGVTKPVQLRLPAVFDYQKQARLAIVTDMPEHTQPNYIKILAQQVKKYVKISNGGAFVLFTSFKSMNEVYELIHDSLEFMGCKLFIQGKSLSRNQMIEGFKETKKGVLFGVASFWAGVDVPGNALRNIIITKLPFPSPADPLMQAQEEIYKKFKKNFFMERSVPITAIMLKQGFGRLIRKSTDKGLVVLLDSRVVTKRYGPLLLSALPSCPIRRVKTTD